MVRIIKSQSIPDNSEYINSLILKDLSEQKKVILIVPEQMALITERFITASAQKNSIQFLTLEVMNFSRLANAVFRRFGGLSYNYIGEGGKQIIMWRVLSSIKGTLKSFSNVTLSDKAMLSKLIKQINELMHCGILPNDIADACDKMQNDANEALCKKAYDIFVIYSTYKAFFRDIYNDPQDDIPRLASILKENNYFDDYNVYVDGFTDFTPVQFDIVSSIMKQAENLFVSVCLPDNAPKNFGGIYGSCEETYKSLKELAKKNNIHLFETKSENLTEKVNQNIKALSEAFFDFTVNEPLSLKAPEGISIVGCSDKFEMAEAVAIEIRKNILAGEKFSDSAVIARDINDYSGVIDAVFERYGIPCFLSRKNELYDRSAIRQIFSAIAIIKSKWKCESVIAYLKSGLRLLTDNECDTLEEYARTWKISGKMWTDGEEWTMNPNGNSDSFHSSSEEILMTVNSAKVKFVDPLIKLQNTFFGKTPATVRGACIAFYEFICESGIRDSLAENGDDGIAIWNNIISAFEELNNTAGEEPVLLEQFEKLFEIIIEQSSYGKLPESNDEVLLGSAPTLRTFRHKHIYIIGVNDGEFPRAIQDDGLFTESDKEILSKFGITLTDRFKQKSNAERLSFLRMLDYSSENLCLYYTGKRSDKDKIRSDFINRLKLLYPQVKHIYFSEQPLSERIFVPEPAFEYLPVFSESPEGDILKKIYSEYPEYNEKFEAFNIPLNASECIISKETSDRIFGNGINFSATQLENYMKSGCGFRYICDRFLHLSERKNTDFNRMDLGVFVHSILEKFVYEYTKNGKNLSDKEVNELLDKIIEDYIESVFPIIINHTKRMEELFVRLKKKTYLIARSIIEELNKIKFKPMLFEEKINNDAESIIKPFSVSLDNNERVVITGKADRIDIFESDGKLYIRIIDYKTGNQEFSFKNAISNAEIQLLLYMFALYDTENGKLLEKLNAGKNDEVIPCGIIYMHVNPKKQEISSGDSPETIINNVVKAIERRGAILDDETVLEAMGISGNNEFIEITPKKDFKKSLDDFTKAKEDLEKTIKEISQKLRDGYASAVSKEGTCKYCNYKNICRIINQNEESYE